MRIRENELPTIESIEKKIEERQFMTKEPPDQLLLQSEASVEDID